MSETKRNRNKEEGPESSKPAQAKSVAPMFQIIRAEEKFMATSGQKAQKIAPPTVSPPAVSKVEQADRSVILQQSPLWSRLIVWGIMGVTSFVVIWASVAKVEEAIPATGKLEPQGTVKEVQAPVNGVVKAIYVKDGKRVKKGDLLLRLDPTTTQVEQESLKTVRSSLIQENQFYRTQMRGVSSLKVPVSDAQTQRFQAVQSELDSRVATAQLDQEQLTKQLNQANIQVSGASKALAINQKILRDLETLTKEGGGSRLQYLKQKQEVIAGQAEKDRLMQEQQRLQLAIRQAQKKVQNTSALTRKDLLGQVIENEKKIADIDSQLSQTKATLQYQELHAPADGIIFDLKANTPGFVTTTSEPILKIVPGDSLVAKVFVTNRDIGFVREGMAADVRIDSFPFSEFGDVKGQLTWIGSDALPPDQIRPYYTFPAKVHLDHQVLTINGRKIQLQSGMGVTVNLRVRERTVMSIFTDLFTRNVESLKFVR
jgi:HlyD family secretion protein